MRFHAENPTWELEGKATEHKNIHWAITNGVLGKNISPTIEREYLLSRFGRLGSVAIAALAPKELW
jgi:hypothetical protein